MHTKNHLHTSLSLLMISLASITVQVSLCDDDYRYTNCSRPIECGIISNIRYPFWGVNRADYCGRPGYEVDCKDDVPVLSNGLRILDIWNENQTLKVAGEDSWTSTCPEGFHNTTPNFTIFNYAPSLTYLTLLFDCPFSYIITIPGFVSLKGCSLNGQTINAFFVPRNLTVSQCNYSVKVPVLETVALALSKNITTIANALDEGFGLQWKDSNDQCNSCTESGGSCGFNWTAAQFTCFCHDQPPAIECHPRHGSKSKGVSVGVGVGVAGAVLVGILLGGWCLVNMKRRRSKAAQTEIQDTPEPSPPSKGPPTSTTYFSRSISSYPSSTSDIEKGSSYFGVQVFSYKELEKATNNFDSSKELGDGGFGTVYHGILRDGRVVAVKRLYESNMKRAEQFINEVQILAHLRHKNLVTLYGCTSRRSQELLLVYEYIPNGTLADHLHGRRADSRLLTWPLRLNIAIETADALAYLHASDVIHRDVKTNNILLDNKFSVKVADFGLSRSFPNDASHVSTAPQGTPGYVDPEYYRCYQLTSKSDVYSFGVVLIELISSLEAVDIKRTREDINLANMAVSRIQNHAVNELVDPCLGFEKDFAIKRMVAAVAELAFLCLQQEREMRPTMEEVSRALKRIEKEYLGSGKAKAVDIRKDDVGLLKHVPIPYSPDSVVQDKWVSSSTTSDSF